MASVLVIFDARVWATTAVVAINAYCGRHAPMIPAAAFNRPATPIVTGLLTLARDAARSCFSPRLA